MSARNRLGLHLHPAGEVCSESVFSRRGSPIWRIGGKKFGVLSPLSYTYPESRLAHGLTSLAEFGT